MPTRCTKTTHDDYCPLVRGVEGDLEHPRVLLLVTVVVGDMLARKTYESGFRRVAEDLALLEGYVCLVELDVRVESRDVDHLAHTRSVEGKHFGRIGIIVGLECREHPETAPEVGHCHLVARQGTRLIGGQKSQLWGERSVHYALRA